MTINKAGFKNLAKSLSLYHRITTNKLNLEESRKKEDELIEKLYVDLLPENGILNEVLEEQTLFLIGRKGTGKSTIFARAQYEIQKSKKNLSVYINAKTIHKKSEINNGTSDFEGLKHLFTKDELMHLQLIRNFITEFKKSLLEELQKEENGFFEKLRNISRNQQISSILEELERLIEEPELVQLNKLHVSENKSIDSEEFVTQIKMQLQNLQLQGKYSNLKSDESTYQNVIAKVFNIGEIIEKIIELINICGRKALYIFIDDYSEMNRNDRAIFMDAIISPFYHLGVEKIHLKIASYPNKIEPIKLDSGKFNLKNIDIYNIYGRDNTITGTEKMAIEYTKRLIENRIDTYCEGSSVEEYFDLSTSTMEDYYRILYYTSMNIPRILGHILNDSYLKNIVYDRVINRNSILDASKQYYYDHINTYFEKQKSTLNENNDDKLDIFVQENLKNALIAHAQRNKYALKETSNSYFNDLDIVPTSHFTILPQNEQYLDELELNGFVSKLNVIAGKGREKESYKNKNRILYCLDRGLCVDEKIEYGKPSSKDTKFYQQRAFEYDDILLMTLKDNKKIVCKSCKTNFIIDELESFKEFGMKCKKCPDGICEVEFDRELKELAEEELSHAIFTESEFDVLYAIQLLNRNLPGEAVTANLISRETDYNSNFIAWRCKKLEESGYIYRSKLNDSSPFIYEITERSIDIIEKIINKEKQFN